MACGDVHTRSGAWGSRHALVYGDAGMLCCMAMHAH